VKILYSRLIISRQLARKAARRRASKRPKHIIKKENL
jgi:hypothetical protein